MTRWSTTALILLTAALCLTASAQQTPTSSPPLAAPAGPQAPAPAAAASESDLVVARVSGEPITEKEVLTRIELLARQTMIKPEQRGQRNTLLFKNALDSLIAISILKNEARKQNITPDKQKVDQQIQEAAKRYPSPEEFRKFLANQGLTEADARKSLEEQSAVDQLLTTVTKDVPPVSDAEIQKVYDSNLDKFAVPERAHVAQLFLKTDPKDTPEQKAEVKKKLEEIRAEIESKKITFKDAVVKYSQDPNPNAPKDGDAGFITRSQVQIKPLEEAIFGAAPGGLTPVVEGPQGYHLVQVIEIKPAGTLSLDEVKATIQQQLDRGMKQRAAQKYIEDLRSKAAIENFMTAEEFAKRHPVQ